MSSGSCGASACKYQVPGFWRQRDHRSRHAGGTALALAGRFTAQRRWPKTAATMPADSLTFGILVLATVLPVEAVCFLPALALGPIAEVLQH